SLRYRQLSTYTHFPYTSLFRSFVSNDADQLLAIRTNKFRASKDRNIKKQIFSHNMTAVTHLSEIPKTINRLEIPVIKRWDNTVRSEEHTSELQSRENLVCRLLL